MAHHILDKPWLKWLLSLVFWTLIALAFATRFHFTQSMRGYPVSWEFALRNAFSEWYVFALLSVPTLRLARRVRLGGEPWQGRWVIHLAASVVFSVLWVALRVAVEKAQGLDRLAHVSFFEMYAWTLRQTFFFNLLVYWVIVAVSHALEYYRGFQERELRTVELERRLAEARLEALQTQLNPHFLFNTLNAISALMHKDVEAADRMIVRLSELLRHALDTVGTQEVPLRQELAFLASYLEIEQTRFGDRLVVRQAIEPAALDAMVPSLVLQPLVENAIKHGIEPHAKPGVIELVARREGAKLRLEVRDNGRGLRREEPWRSGVGLSNTKARLEALYGDSHCLEFSDRADGGLVVQMTIPWKTDGALHESAGPVGRN